MSRRVDLPRRAAGIATIAAAALLTGCLRLPETTTGGIDPETTDPDALRDLVTLTDLGICTEDGWSGVVASRSAHSLTVDVSVIFKGLGSTELGEGTTTVDVAATRRADFDVKPRVALDEPALSCNIEISTIDLNEPPGG